jgi:hypothetical protein
MGTNLRNVGARVRVGGAAVVWIAALAATAGCSSRKTDSIGDPAASAGGGAGIATPAIATTAAAARTDRAAETSKSTTQKAKLAIKLKEDKANGKPWDAAGDLPDIGICVGEKGKGRTCYPGGGEKIRGGSPAVCKDSLQCDTEVVVPAGASSVFLEIWDIDALANDAVGSGSCSLNGECTIGQATIAVQSAREERPAVAETAAPATAAPAVATAQATADAAADDPAPVASSPAAKPASEAGAKLDALIAKAISEKEFDDKIEDKEWAFYQANSLGCGGGMRDDGSEFDKRIDLPATDNEFELQRLVATRGEIQKSLIDTIVKVEGSERVEPKNYDFAKKSFQLRVGNTASYSSHDRWPFPGGEPKFSRESFMIDGKADTGLRIGGKKVQVDTQTEMATYNNVSAIQVTVPVEPAEAETWSKSGVQLEFVFVQRFKGMGFHRACKRSCSVIFGTNVCTNDNEGKGPYYKTVALGHRISVDGRVVAEVVSEK